MPKPINSDLETLLQAWELNDPTGIFSGMTLEQFRTAIAPSLSSRKKLSELKQESRGAIATRKLADTSANEDYLRVVNAIRGSEVHGENSPFYRALGYKPAMSAGPARPRKWPQKQKRPLPRGMVFLSRKTRQK
jgi:hypothetical protein